MGGLMVMLVLLVAPLLFAGFVALLALPLIAEYDPDVLFHLLLRPKRKPKQPEIENIRWKSAIPRLALVIAFGALIGAKVAGAISTDAFFVGLGTYAAVLFLLNRLQRP